MRAHELARELLKMPDVEVVTREPGDGLFSIKEALQIAIKHCDRRDYWLFFDYDEKYDEEKDKMPAIELR